MTQTNEDAVGAPEPAGTTGRWLARRFGGLGAGYWKLFSASVVSNLGDGITFVAYPWLAAELTRDPLLIAGVPLALRLPWLLVSLPAGAVVDRVDRRQLMTSANAFRFLVTAVVGVAVLGGFASLPLLYVAAVLLGTAEVLYDNAAQTIMPSIVSADRLERANGNLWSAETITNQFAGPPLGGFLVAVSLSLPFLVDAGTFGVSALLIFLIAGGYRARGVAGPAAGQRRSLRTEIAEGLGWLWRHRLLRTLGISLGFMNLASTAAFATFVLFAQEILGLGATGFGLLLAALAVGAVIGGQVAPALSRRLGAGTALALCVAGEAGTFAVTGLASNAFVVAAASVVSGVIVLVWNVITVSLRQQVIPDRLLGRVNSVYRLFGWGMIPIGALIGGLLVEAGTTLIDREAGLRTPLLFAAAVHLVLLLVVATRLSTARIEAARAAAEDPATTA